MTMPATLLEVAAAVRELLADGEARTKEQLVDALLGRGLDLGVEPAVTLSAALDAEEVGLVLPLGDGRHALLPALLHGRSLTHRVGAAEVEHGFVELSPDLEPVSLLTEDETYCRLTDGAAVVEVFPTYDDQVLAERGIPVDAIGEGAWLLEPDALRRLGVEPGDLVGVTVRPEGFELTAVPAAEAAVDLPARLAGALQRLGEGEPAEIDCVVWLACADDPTLFRSLGAPLAEVLGTAGLAWEGELVAPAGFDFAVWRVAHRVQHLAHVHRLDEDAALAVLTLSHLYEDVSVLIDQAQQAVDAGGSLSDLLPDSIGHESDAAGAPGNRMLVRATAGFLADPEVAQALQMETIGAGREGAAALGLFAESLEPEVPRAVWPALRWLRGKAHERLGEVLEAERAYEAALAIDDAWPLALFELARNASDRGDAERGLSLLRRAGAPDDDELVVLLRRFRPVERSDIGRNEPCWCGSGRKYKVCHRGREQLPLEERAAWLYQKAGTYLAEGPWRAEILEAALIRSRWWDEPLAVLAGIQDPLVCDAVLFEGGAFAEFLAERGELLPDDERLLGEQWLLAERSVYDVEAVRAGSGFTARDLRTGDRLEVRERTASRALEPGMLICARLVSAGETVQCFGGIEPVALHERDELVRVLDDEPGPAELVEVLSRRLAPPMLQNTEGEDLIFCEATLRSRDPAAFAAALDGAYDRVEDEQDEQRWFEHVTIQGMERIRASLVLDADELTVETNSAARMDRVLDTVRRLQPGLQVIGQTRRAVEDLREAMSRAPGGARPDTLVDPAEHPEVAAALEQITRQHEQAWLDQDIPALGGVTPREAAADPTRRPDLIRLLDSFPAGRPGTMDPDRVRSALGL